MWFYRQCYGENFQSNSALLLFGERKKIWILQRIGVASECDTWSKFKESLTAILLETFLSTLNTSLFWGGKNILYGFFVTTASLPNEIQGRSLKCFLAARQWETNSQSPSAHPLIGREKTIAWYHEYVVDLIRLVSHQHDSSLAEKVATNKELLSNKLASSELFLTVPIPGAKLKS